MQLTIDIDDNLAQQFFDNVPKNKQKTVLQTLLSDYLTQKSVKYDEEKPVIRQGDDEVYGMWADDPIDVETYMRTVRKGRQFHVN